MRYTLSLILLLGYHCCSFSYQPWIKAERYIQEENWQAIIELTKSEMDTSAQCYRALARQKLAIDKTKVVDQLWNTPFSQPKACDHVFRYWKHNQLLTDAHYLHRIVTSLRADNVQFAKYLSQSMIDFKDANLALTVYKDPKQIINIVQGRHIPQDIIILALEQIAKRNSPDEAESYYQVLKKDYVFDEQGQTEIAKILSVYYAVDDSEKTLRWYELIVQTQPDTLTIEWQIRYHLRHANWDQIKALILSMSKSDYQKSVWQYWLAQSFKANGEQATYKVILKKISQQRDFYGMIAALELKKDLPISLSNKELSHYEISSMQAILKPLKQLARQGKHYSAHLKWMKKLSYMNGSERLAAAHSAYEWELPALSIKTANTLETKEHLKLRFPIHYKEAVRQCTIKYKFPEELIYALIRQESAFQNHAHSGDGAKGLMQLLPSTAKYIAKQRKIRGYYSLNQPSKNIELGCAYLDYLKKKYDGQMLLAIAAYNMGPGNLKEFIPEDDSDLLVWIETLPRAETRNYIKNLLTYKLIYDFINNKTPTLKDAL